MNTRRWFKAHRLTWASTAFLADTHCWFLDEHGYTATCSECGVGFTVKWRTVKQVRDILTAMKACRVECARRKFDPRPLTFSASQSPSVSPSPSPNAAAARRRRR